MKKLSILLSGALALAAFTACDDAPEAAMPQKNPQPAIFQSADVTATPAAAIAAAEIDLDDYTEAGIIEILPDGSDTPTPAGSEVTFELQISPDQNFAVENVVPIEATVANGVATVFTEDWNNAHRSLFGKGLDPVKVYYRVYGYISLDNTLYMVANPAAEGAQEAAPVVFAQGEITETPYLVIERPDFVVVASNANGWSTTDGKSLLYWGEKDGTGCFRGASVANNNDGGFKFVWDGGWYGLNADGILADVPDNIKAPVDATRLYWFTVDTDNLTYTIDEVTSLGIIGLGGQWSEATDVVEMTPSDDYLTWTV
ncbi:MAG: hypothetical protein K2G30_07500, partial [Muribaculaceae bacterium]|nr:hypothetical protein [Muribaculaceae bacterium]